jgi:two-component SAPR family response regulator
MIKLLLVTHDRASFNEFALVLAQNDDVELSWAGSGQRALDMVSVTALDLVVVDEKLDDMTGIEFIEALVSVNPMINCAAVSPLPSDEFHEVSEGLGILAQLPVQPGPKDAEDLLKHLNHLKKLLQPKT